MERWVGKIAVVTGASDGIGAAIALSLADSGMKVIGLARREQKIQELSTQVKGKGSISARHCDMSKTEDIAATFKWVQENFGAVHLLVNNAGVFHPGNFTDLADAEISEEQMHSVVDVNYRAALLCTRLVISSMKKHSVNDGHIVNISSLASHYVPFSALFNVYSSSKYAITAFSQALNNELSHLNSNIKVTNVSPGLVATAMAGYANEQPALQPAHVADAVLYAVATPPELNISEITLSHVREKRL